MNETMVTVVGTVISEIKGRHTQDGVAVANFRIAGNERRWDKETSQWVDGNKLYLPVTCWRKLATSVQSTLRKGDPVVVRGRLYTRSYDSEGVKRWVTEIEAQQLGLDLSRCQVDVRRTDRPDAYAGEFAASMVPEPALPGTAADALSPAERRDGTTGGDSSELVTAGTGTGD